MNTGLGVLINALTNDHGEDVMIKAIGQKITNLKIENNQLQFHFDNGLKMGISDEGQSCCEERYMTTDDDLNTFIGATLIDLQLRDVKTTMSEYGSPHEISFLIINTSLGDITIETHNVHNGYYGGFWIKAKEL
jgi:hypothetical protein